MEKSNGKITGKCRGCRGINGCIWKTRWDEEMALRNVGIIPTFDDWYRYVSIIDPAEILEMWSTSRNGNKNTPSKTWSWRMHGTGRVSFRLIGIHGGKLGGSSCTSQSGTCPSCDRWSHEESGAIPSKDLRHPFTCEILGDLPINKRQIVCSLLMPPTFTCLEGSKVARIWGWWSTALYTVTLRHSINRKRRLHRIEFQDQASRGHIPLHGDWKTPPPPASSAPPCCSHHLASEAFLGSGSTWMIPLWIRMI